ncbi:MAG TPA: hypothetical protein VHY30_07800 [Verrucomicrobiae bacterium]|nr:hypothetical protein [Verrucomicrobiae bacterium]
MRPAIKHIYPFCGRANVQVENQDDGMLAAFGKFVAPDVELVFHSGNPNNLPLANSSM